MNVLVAALLFSVLVVVIKIWSIKAKPRPGVPCPANPHWYLGHLPTILKNKDRFFQWHVEESEKHKKTWHIAVPGRSNFKLVDGASIEHVLKTNFHNYPKTIRSFEKDLFIELIGPQGIFMSQGAEWRGLRKSASHLFSQKVLNTHMEEAFLKNGNILVGRLEKLKAGESINMQDMLFRFTMDSFCEIAYGATPNSLSADEEPQFSVAFDRVQMRIVARRMEPELICRFKRFFQTAQEKQMTEDAKVLDEFILNAIAERRKAHEDQSQNPLITTKTFSGDLITLFIDHAKSRGEKVSDKFLRDQAMSMLLAGRDTTASLLTSIFQMLSKHPGVEKKVVDEIMSVVGEDEPTHHIVKQLKYCEAVFKETLRLFPAAWINWRTAVVNDTLPDGTFIPAGCEVQWLPWVQGRDPKLYGPDPLTYRPERWLEEDKELPKLDKFDNPAFNAGPRVCLGRGMSYLEARMVMVLILQKGLRLRLVPGQNLEAYDLALTLTREHGQLMTVTRE